MTGNYQATLRNRLIARRNRPAEPSPIDIPLIGIIAVDVVNDIQEQAIRAKAGDVQARGLLYSTFERRLGRMGYVLRTWPNTPDSTGIWDRDDVNQEGWIVLAELLASWDGNVPFVKYLFARFPWRLKDRILRGIGKPLPPIGTINVPAEHLESLLFARDDEQPESALMASGLLDDLINQRLVGDDSGGQLTALRSPETIRDTQRLNSKTTGSELDVA